METDSALSRLAHTGPGSAAERHAASLSPSNVTGFSPALRLLALDAHGRALDWMSWQDAACLYARGAVAWTLGEP